MKKVILANKVSRANMDQKVKKAILALKVQLALPVLMELLDNKVNLPTKFEYLLLVMKIKQSKNLLIA